MKNNADSSAVKDILKGLNSQQEKAVTASFNRHWLVLAGAGCGKTSVLTKRIAFCAQAHCPQHKILALTFTRKAAEEMKERVYKLPGIEKNDTPPVVTTFHGFGLQVLRDTVLGMKNSARLGYTTEPALLNGEERVRLLAEVSTTDQRRSLGISITGLDDLLARQDVNPDRVMALPESVRAALRKTADDFSRVKIERSRWEFSDMIKQALALFENHVDVKRHYAAAFSAILVDEFQDTNPLQITMLHALLSPQNRVFAVGDDDQAIYGFRGADIGPTMNFDGHFPGAGMIKLEMNYRSTPAILKTANRIFSDKPLQFRKSLVSGRYADTAESGGARPQKWFFADHEKMIRQVLDTARLLQKNEKIAVSSMAMLFRLNETLSTAKEMMTGMCGADAGFPTFITVHGSKGLEFPVVFLCDLEESIFPHYKIQKSRKINTWTDLVISVFRTKKKKPVDCDFDEEQRLFYVGVTRAERFLYLISVKEKLLHGRKVQLKPSRFLRLV